MTKVDQIIGWISIEIVYKVNTKGIASFKYSLMFTIDWGLLFVILLVWTLFCSFELLLFALFFIKQKSVRPRPCIPNIQIQHT